MPYEETTTNKEDVMAKEAISAEDAEERFRQALKTKVKDIQLRRTQFWEPQVSNKNLIRVLRKGPGDPWFYETVVHYGLGPEKRDRATCLRPLGLECPACVETERLKEAGTPPDKERADKIKASKHYLMNVLDCNDLEQGVQVFRCRETILVQLTEYFFDTEYGDFTHPHEGYNVKITRTGQGIQGTRYTTRLSKQATPLPNPNVLNTLKDLATVFPSRSAEEIQALIDPPVDGLECFGAEWDEDDETCKSCGRLVECGREFANSSTASATWDPSPKSGNR
jgi:hypothetical protein